ncbi:Ig-like domain-containing protein [Nocardioides sp. BP30]|uniref:Ig-like domain-containing protein n=1 Tax=Nocardioides sp. BP30 TaxID=3036374 RepID=UPI002468F69C|nr:Ig-like domain-containing protein [Nocardioides sp. BP30]WGL53221.1 Ig-like domain-containing protein [Nocardioides sp. BP30]
MGFRGGGRAWLAPYLALVLVVAGVVVFAVQAQGFQTHKAELNDGGIWVTDSRLGYYGRVNKPIGQLDGALFARTDATLDIVQEGAAVVGVDAAGGSVSTIDPATVAVPGGASAQIPVGGQVVLYGGTLAVLDPGTGKVWAMPVDDEAGDPLVSGIDAGSKPLATVGANAAMTVTASGRVVLAAAGSTRLTTLTPDHGRFTLTSATLPRRPGEGLSLTAVGDRVVLLDPAASTVTVLSDGRAGAHAQVGADAVLQQPGPADDSVLVADGSRLLAVGLDDGTTTTLAHDLAGTPARPVRLGDCQYGAWGGAAGLVVTRCGGGTAQVGQLGAGTSTNLVFRVNRGSIVLNDSTTGAVWNVDDKQPTRLDDWQSFQKKIVQHKSDDRQKDQASADRSPPKAQPDHFGARPGRTTVLHPLDNDAAPAGRLLAISAVQDVRPQGAAVSVSPDGQTVEITMPARPAARTTFEYYVNDGRQGVSAHATVTVDARSATQNRPPALRKGYQALRWDVPAAGAITLPVLPDWRDDADGDPLGLASAKIVSGPQGATARVTASGQVRFTAPTKGGEAVVEYGVTDGIAPPVSEQVHVHVQALTDHQAHAATAQPDVVVGQAGKPITIHPLDNDLPGSDPITPDATLKLAGKVTSTGGGQVDTDVANGTVTFRSTAPRTYFLDYDAAFGNAPFSRGRIRVDVRAADHPPKAPVAMPDSLTLYGQSAGMVDVLANDVDPAGQLLVVQTAATTTTGQLDVAVVGGRWVRISAARPDINPNPQVVHYTISDGDRSGIQGDIVVSQRPEPQDDTPVTQDDQVTVRAGSGTQVSVLDNDYSPDGEQLHLVSDPVAGTTAGQLGVEAPGEKSALGQAFVSGRTVRFNAPASVTDTITETVTYVAANERGDTAPGTLRVTVLPADQPNQAPEPTVLEGRVVAGDQVRLQLPGSGVDPDGDPVTLTGISSAPSLGRVLRAGADSLVYQAFPDSAGTDDFTYTVADPNGGTATGTVRVGVVPPAVPAAPVAVDDTATVAPGRTMTVDVLANDQVAATDRVTVALVRPAPGGVSVDAETGAMRIKAPARADGREVQVNYTISDGVHSSQATVTLRTQSGYDNPPVIEDAYGTDAAGGAGSARVSVDVLKTAYDPDGPASALTVTSVAAPAGIRAQVRGGTITIDRAGRPMVVPFVVADGDGGVATARLYVPAKGDATPYVRADALIDVPPGQDVAADLADYVVNPSRGPLTFTLKDRVWAAPDAGVSASITGKGTFTVHAAKDYAGPGAVSFEVTTGRSTAILSVPVQVGETKPVLRCPSDPLPVAQGQKILLDVGSICHVWTAQAGQALSYAADWKTSSAGLAIVDAQGAQVSVAAAADAAPGTRAVLQLRANGSDPAYLPVTVVAVPPPTLAPISISDLKAGQSRTIDLAPYLHAGVPVPQPQIVSIAQTTALDVHATVHGASVTLSAGPKAFGKATFGLVMSDVAGNPPPNRTVAGTLTLSLQATPDAPAAPHPGKSGDGAVPLSWTAPAANGSPITSYEVRADHGGPTVTCPTTSCTVTGLTNGVDYSFQVRASNAVGSSAWSPSSSTAAPDVAPFPVTGITEAAVGDGSITLHWTKPSNKTSAVTYTVTYPGGTPIDTTRTEATVSGLSNDNTYVFTIVATNTKGQQSQPALSAPYQSVGSPGTPAAPTITTTPSADDTAVVTVSWNQVDPNGPGPVRYRVIAVPYADGGACTQDPDGITGTSCTFSSIAYDGTQYQFEVEALSPGTGSGVTGGQPRRSTGAKRSWKAVGLPAPWGGWSLDATGSDEEASVHGFSVPNSHGGTSTFKVVRGDDVVYSSASPPPAVTVNTPDNDQPYSFHLEVCNENGECSKSSTKSVTTYGPLGDNDILSVDPIMSGYDVGWRVTVDSNGKSGVSVVLRNQDNVQLGSWTTTDVDVQSFEVDPTYLGYDATQSVTATISDAGRRSGKKPATSGRTPDLKISVGRGAKCGGGTDTACTDDDNCTDQSCGYLHITTQGYGDATGSTRWSCYSSQFGRLGPFTGDVDQDLPQSYGEPGQSFSGRCTDSSGTARDFSGNWPSN